MALRPNAEQLQLRESIVEFAQRELNPGARDRDAHSTFDREKLKACAEFGLFRGGVSKEWGGREESVKEVVWALECLGYGCRDQGLTLAVNSLVWTILVPLLEFGSQEQKLRYLPGLLSGDMLAADAITEQGAGSDALSMTTVAEKVADGYLLKGRKSFVGMCGVCDLALVFAKTDPDAGAWGISAFLVEANSPGFRQEACFHKMGLRSLPFGEMIFDDCLVSEEQRLGGEGAGLSIFQHTIDWERSFILTSQVGAMAWQMEQCVGFAREREQFGQKIGEFQAVSHRLAEMKLRVETSRLHLYRMAELKEQGETVPGEAALANLYLSEAAVENSLAAIRIHGARGYVTEFEVERDLRDAVGGVIYAGTSDVQKNIIARYLGLTR